jgi:FixJ family two-component response regulator
MEAALPRNKLISIIDDDDVVRKAIARLIKSLGYKVQAFPSAVAFLKSPCVQDTACLITDIQMPHMTGVELHGHLVKSGQPIPTILITAYLDESVRTRVLANGVVCYLIKPFAADTLLACVRTALERADPR